MKKILLFISVILISFVSCDTLTQYTLNVSVDREPAIIIENKTGHPVILTSPVQRTIDNGTNAYYQPAESNNNIDVVYRIGQIEFTEKTAFNNTDTTVVLTKRPPTITVVNNTGREINLIAPVSTRLRNGETNYFLPPAVNQTIDISYRIGQMTLVEQVNMRNQDVTVTLTRRPPVVTIVNNTGVSINLIFMRPANTSDWIGGNIQKRDGVVTGLARSAQTQNVSESIVNGDRLAIPMENIEIRGDRFDIRLDAVGGSPTFVKRNVQIRNDIILTFTNADR